MNLHTLSPYVRRAMRSHLRAPFNIGQRSIFDYEIIYLAAGKFIFNTDGKDYLCKKGDVIFIRPGHPHTLVSIDNVSISQPHIHFDMRYDENSDNIYISFKDIPRFSEHELAWIREDEVDIGPILRISDKEAFTKLLYSIIDTFEQKPPFFQLKCKEQMLALIKIVLEDNTVAYEKDHSIVSLPAMIKHYIDYNFRNPISLDSLEKQFNYNKFHISRTFLEHTGTSVIKYYNQKRLKHAKGMLEAGATVSEVVEELHFGSIYAFSRFFKNAEGVAPSVYSQTKHPTE